MNRFYPTFLALLLLLALLVAACAAPAGVQTNPQAVGQAVEATLTAVTESDVSAEAAVTDTPEPAAATTDTPEPETKPGPEAMAPEVVIPALVPDFDPAARAASSKGDPDAPVVIYEWSDYT